LNQTKTLLIFVNLVVSPYITWTLVRPEQSTQCSRVLPLLSADGSIQSVLLVTSIKTRAELRNRVFTRSSKHRAASSTFCGN